MRIAPKVDLAAYEMQQQLRMTLELRATSSRGAQDPGYFQMLLFRNILQLLFYNVVLYT